MFWGLYGHLFVYNPTTKVLTVVSVIDNLVKGLLAKYSKYESGFLALTKKMVSCQVQANLKIDKKQGNPSMKAKERDHPLILED